MPEQPEARPEDAAKKPAADDALEALHTAADTVGMVPNVRMKDNLIQGAVVLGGALISAIVGYFVIGEPRMHGVDGVFRWYGAAIGGVAGLLGFGLLSGLVLMVLGWVRTARKLKK